MKCIYLNSTEFFFTIPIKSIAGLLKVPQVTVFNQVSGAYPISRITLDDGKGITLDCICFEDFASLVLDFHRLGNLKAIEIVKECFLAGLVNNN